MGNTPFKEVRVVAIGETVIDELRKDGIVTSVPGGCPMNGAIALSRQCIKAAVLSPVSTDKDGTALISHMQSSGVDISLLKMIDEPTTRVIIPIDDNNDGSYYLADGVHTQMFWDPAHVYNGPQEGDILLVSGSFSLAFKQTADVFDEIFNVGSQHHIIYFDPNVRTGFIGTDEHDIQAAKDRFDRWVTNSTIVKLSIEDAHWRYPDQEPWEIVEQLLGDSAKLVFLTSGPDSVLVGSRRMGIFEVQIEALEESEIVDTVGAGDTFNAGTLKWLIENGKHTKDAITQIDRSQARDLVQSANRLAAQVCKVPGANPPWDESLRANDGNFAIGN